MAANPHICPECGWQCNCKQNPCRCVDCHGISKEEQQILLQEWSDMYDHLEEILSRHQEIDDSYPYWLQRAANTIERINKRTDALEDD